MNEKIIKALLRLFAIVANVDEEGLSPYSKKVVKDFLSPHLSRDQINTYLDLFDQYLKIHHKKTHDEQKIKKRLALNSVKILTICFEINEELQQHEKVIVYIRLLEFIKANSKTLSPEEQDFVYTVADVFNIPRDEYISIRWYIFGKYNKVVNQQWLFLIDSFEKNNSGAKHMFLPHLEGQLTMLFIPSTRIIIFIYKGNEELYLNGFVIQNDYAYVFDTGSVINGNKIQPIYYSDILSQFLEFENAEKITFCVDKLSFRYKNSNNGLHEFSMLEESGHLVGIMGSSGVGKSTLINLLIGNLRPDSGNIYINGYNLHKDENQLKGIIGFVPQEDLLIEELTVFENLFLNAKLCLDNYSEEEIKNKVYTILQELNLLEIKDLTVGSALNKLISGGQRKRLNIALELIREPAILFVDEPTSGLSSADAQTVMLLLKELTFRGKLVFVNIHQPSSDLYKLFDKIIVLDKGGYIAFYGHPLDAIVYFKKMANLANAEEAVCPTCGNVKPETVLNILEAKVVNEYGRLTSVRKIKPEQWHALYKENIEPKLKKDCPAKHDLPKSKFKIASYFKQLKIFAKRDILRKLTNKQYLIITFTEAPILALILAFFSKYFTKVGTEQVYIFAKNVNIPPFLFMAVTVALFLGLTLSAEEIIKDRHILKREKFLNLSRWAYINSKVIIQLIIVAIQTLTFVIVANSILEIKGLWFEYWLILFSTAAFGSLLSLNISSGLNSVVAIYISIPLLLVPQLLFSGTILDFSKMHKDFANAKYVPVIGDVMTSRWAYEALMVAQYKHNKYEKNFFDVNKTISDATYYSSSYYDKLEELLRFCRDSMDNPNSTKKVNLYLDILKNEFTKINQLLDKNFDTSVFSRDKFDQSTYNSAVSFIYYKMKLPFNKLLRKAQADKDSIYEQLCDKLGGDKGVVALKNKYHNKRVAEIVLNRNEINEITIQGKELVRLFEPIYATPQSNYGRAQLYAPYKIVGYYQIDTPWFNILVIWIFNLILYIALVTDFLRKTLNLRNKNIL